jgi:hypothetical protein
VHNPAVLDPKPGPADDAGPLSPTVAHRITAVVELPFDNLEQATAALQGHLRHMLTERLNLPAGQPVQVMDWDTLTVDGPTQQTDPGGRTWFTYTGTASSRLLRRVDPVDTGQQPQP